MRLFVESGPRGNLSAFAEDVLSGLPFVAMPANVPRRSGLTQLNHLLAALLSHHVPLDLGPLYEHRAPAAAGPGRPGPQRPAACSMPPCHQSGRAPMFPPRYRRRWGPSRRRMGPTETYGPESWPVTWR